MLTAYSRVTVVTAQRTIDLALPSSMPLADVIPQVLRYAAPEQSNDVPTSWTLGRLGGQTLQLSQTLEDAGVLDGDVLELRSQREDVSPAMVEDVRDAVEDSVDAAGGVWTTRVTCSFVVLVVAAFFVAWAALAIVPISGPVRALGALDEPIGAAAAVAGLLFALWWSSVYARPIDVQLVTCVAMLWGLLLGRSVAIAFNLDPQLVLVCAMVVFALVAIAARLISAAVTAHATFALVLLIAAIAMACVAYARFPTMQGIRVLPVLSLLAVGVLPRVSLSVGGLASADYRVRHVGQLDLATLRRRYKDSNGVLIGGLYALAVLVTMSGVLLDLSDGPWDRTLAGLIAIAALLRSRLFSRTQHVIPLRVAGLVVAGAAVARFVASDSAWLPFFLPATAVASAVALGITIIPSSEITKARIKRILNITEFLVMVTVLVVAAGALGLYGQLGGLFE